LKVLAWWLACAHGQISGLGSRLLSYICVTNTKGQNMGLPKKIASLSVGVHLLASRVLKERFF
jgi:hypothetical protein